MNKKGLLSLILLIGAGGISACSSISEPTKPISETHNSDNRKHSNTSKRLSKEKEDLYNELSSNANSPKMLEHSNQFNQEITFIAQIEGEPKQIESKDNTLNGEWYVSIFLMRNRSKPIYLNLSDIKKEAWPKSGDVIRINGTPIGYLYTSYKNKRVDLLDIKATTIEIVEFENKNVATSKAIETDQYKVEITDTDVLFDVFNDPCLVIYYNFKNKKEYTSIPPFRTYFFLSQKEEQLENALLGGNGRLDPKALNGDTLESNGEMLYYEVFKLLNPELPICLNVYDDEYNLLNTLEIPGSATRLE